MFTYDKEQGLYVSGPIVPYLFDGSVTANRINDEFTIRGVAGKGDVTVGAVDQIFQIQLAQTKQQLLTATGWCENQPRLDDELILPFPVVWDVPLINWSIVCTRD